MPNFRLRAHGRCDRWAEGAYSSAAPNFHFRLFHVHPLGTDFSVYLAGLTDLDYRLCRSPNLNTLNLTTNIWPIYKFWMWLTACVIDPDSTFSFDCSPYCPTLDFVVTLWTMITFHTLLTSLFCVLSLSHITVQSFIITNINSNFIIAI
jgi:hypothetical protein